MGESVPLEEARGSEVGVRIGGTNDGMPSGVDVGPDRSRCGFCSMTKGPVLALRLTEGR